jgi:hypothetical protein
MTVSFELHTQSNNVSFSSRSKYNEVPLVFGTTSLARYSYQVSDETVLQVLLTAWDKVKNDRKPISGYI